MATDYKKIKPIINLRSIRQSSDKTHFIYELIQNAYDSKSRHLELHLHENELLVWNDGDQFSQEDVHRICSIGFSAKDLTQVGHYGIGFKAVYNYTDRPEVYSGDERFCIPDPTSTRKTLEDLASSSLIEGIDEVPPRIVEHINKGRTVFRLPFRDSLSQEDITLLKNQLRDLDKRVLLFLQDFKHELKSIQWCDERDGQIGSYSCCHSPHDKIQNASEVELTISLNGKNQLSETFLVFRKEVQPRQDVVDKLLQQAEDDEEQQRIQKSAEKKQPVEVAFKLHEDRIIETDNSVLFAYLPTEKETHLRFLIQARYQTTPPRDNIVKSSDSPWNEWLVQETADFLPEILEQLKVGGLLEPAFFNVLPLKGEVENEFKPIAEALQKAMQERAFVPTQSGGYAKAESVFHVNSKGVAIPRGIEYRYAKAQNVYYPHTEILRQLIESNWFHPESSWLHPEIRRDTEEFRQCFTVMQEAGVKPVEINRVLGLLEERALDFKDQSNEWLRSLYTYLKEQKSQLERIKKLPLVRLENGQHVPAWSELVFFPPGTDEVREEIEPFLKNLPILQSVLLEGEERNEIEAFLKSVGVKVLRRVDMILEGICPQYLKSTKPSVEENRLHVRYLFKVWNDVSEFEQSRLKRKISEIPILWGYKSQNSVVEFRYIKPCDAYLPQTYTSDDDLETYFSVYNGDIWFVDDKYLTNKSDTKAWLQFLKAIGAIDTPRVIKRNIPVDYKECSERSIQRSSITRTGEETIEDHSLYGLSVVLNEINKHRNVKLSQVLWSLLVKALPLAEQERETFFKETYKGTYRSKYRSNSYTESDHFDAVFYRQLKLEAWIPDEQGNLHSPNECFRPTSENQEILGDSVTYVHSDFDMNTRPAQWLAKKLDVRLEADADDVLNYLQTLSQKEASIEKVEPLYRFLRSESEDTQLRRTFKQKPLIFTSNIEPRWWRVDEVFWKDESTVFDNHRGYLIGHYPETLKPFFTSLGVSEQASQMDYARHIQETASTEQVEDEKVRERVQRLYKCLQPWREKKWEIIYDSRCWLGKRGDEWGFFTRQELVLKDHPHIGEIFEGEVPFWTFDGDLSSLARNLRVEGCSQAEVEFHPEGDQEEDTDWSEKVRKLRPYIYAFLNSPRLCEEPDIFMFSGNEEVEKEKFAKFSTNCSVRRVKELRVTYELKGTSVSDPNPRQSFLDVTNQPPKLWLGLEENEDEYPELIGDALQDYFDATELGRFVEDLLSLSKDRNRVLSNWKRKGLQTKLLDEDPKDNEGKPIESIDEKLPDELNSRDVDPTVNESDMKIPTGNEISKTDGEDNESLTDKADESEIRLSSNGDDDSRTDGPEIETPIDSERVKIDKSDDGSTLDESESPINPVSDIQNISLPDTQASTNTGSGTTQNADEESESETPTVHEDPEVENGDDNSTENESETSTYKPRRGGSRTRPRGGKAINMPNRNQDTGHSSNRSSDMEDDAHMEETNTSPHDRKEIERIGMEHARRYEEEQGHTVEDVSAKNLGFDLRSTTPNGEIRCIEVKARAKRALVVLTSNEWETAEQLKDSYFLYVVLNAETQPERYIIQNPTDKVAVEERFDVRYQVPLWEITEHGKLV